VAEIVSLAAATYSGLDVGVFRQGHQKHLKSLRLMIDFSLQKLNGNIFKHLTALTELSLWADNLTYIGDNAFAIDEPSNSTLRISLRDNDHLTASSFARNSLIGINRPTSIDLSKSVGFISEITYFPEDVFGPFFAANPLNVIDSFESSNFDCQDCKSYWLKQRALFKRIPDLTCSDGRAIDDPDNFKNCHTEGSYSQMPLVNRIDHGDGVNVNLKPIIIEESNRKKIIVGDKIKYNKNL
jgi:hypothetical protein